MEIPLEALVVAATTAGGSLLAVAGKLATAFNAYVERRDREVAQANHDAQAAHDEKAKTVERVMRDGHERFMSLLQAIAELNQRTDANTSELRNLADMLGEKESRDAG